MEIANVRIRLNKLGSDVPKFNITPAEAIMQHVMHQQANGGSTFGDDMQKIEVTGDAMSLKNPDKERTDLEELQRLQKLYGSLTNKKGDKLIRLVFPDFVNPRLPQKFSEIDWKSISYDGLEVAPFDYGTSGGRAITM